MSSSGADAPSAHLGRAILLIVTMQIMTSLLLENTCVQTMLIFTDFEEKPLEGGNLEGKKLLP